MLCSLFLWNDRFFSSWRNITCFDVDRCSLPSSGCSPTAQSASLGAQLAPGPCPTAVIALLPSPSYPSVTGMGWEGNVQVKFKFLPVAFLKGNLINLSKFPSGNTCSKILVAEILHIGAFPMTLFMFVSQSIPPTLPHLDFPSCPFSLSRATLWAWWKHILDFLSKMAHQWLDLT